MIAVDPAAIDPEAIDAAAHVLRAGGLVAFPTETVYGLGADALDARAVRGIFTAKGRPATNPLIVHVAGVAEAQEVVRAWPERATALAARFWPGPLTLVLPKREIVPDEVTAGLDSVAVRVPAHPVAIALLRAVARPLAAPSANRSTGVSPTTADHVVASLGGAIDLVLDAGPADVGIESTVLSLVGEPAMLLRPGQLSRAAIEAVIGPVVVRDATVPDARAPSQPWADGTSLRAACPRRPGSARRCRRAEPRAGLDGRRRRPAPHHRAAAAMPMPSSCPTIQSRYARGLYAALHMLDARAELIVVERVPDDDAWHALRDRLARASHA